MDSWIEELSADSFRYNIYQMLAHLVLQYLSFHMQESNTQQIQNRPQQPWIESTSGEKQSFTWCQQTNVSWQTHHEEHTFPSRCALWDVRCLCTSCIQQLTVKVVKMSTAQEKETTKIRFYCIPIIYCSKRIYLLKKLTNKKWTSLY